MILPQHSFGSISSLPRREKSTIGYPNSRMIVKYVLFALVSNCHKLIDIFKWFHSFFILKVARNHLLLNFLISLQWRKTLRLMFRREIGFFIFCAITVYRYYTRCKKNSLKIATTLFIFPPYRILIDFSKLCHKCYNSAFVYLFIKFPRIVIHDK